MSGDRPLRRRIVDSVARFKNDVDCIVATSSPTGAPNAVPLSFVWVNRRFYICTRETNRTVCNVRKTGAARLVLGPTRDVVLVDGHVTLRSMESCPAKVRDAFKSRVDWEIAEESGDYVLMVVKPHKVQAWRMERELTIMRDGRWLDGRRANARGAVDKLEKVTA